MQKTHKETTRKETIHRQRWVVELPTKHLHHVSKEQLELAVSLEGQDGYTLLIYRETFTAYKVAASSGGQVLSAEVLRDDAPEQRNTVRLANGVRIALTVPSDFRTSPA